MNKFQVIQPSELLAPYVKQYWFVTLENRICSSQRLVPLGSVALSFHRGDRTYSSLEKEYLPQSHLFGITTEYTNLSFSGRIDFICVVFQPVGARAFFRMPVKELNNRYVALDLLNDAELNELEQRLSHTPDDFMCVRFIEEFLIRRIYRLEQYNEKRMNAVAESICRGETNIDRLAGTACLGYKQFKRIFRESIGVNPKTFLKIRRFRKLHHLFQQHAVGSLEQLAYECGYYDKSHLIRELKTFSGFTPTELHDACDPEYSDYHALFRSVFVDLPSGSGFI